MSENWYSIVEYARRFNVSDMTIRRRIKTGKLNAVLKEGKYYIPVSVNERQSISKNAEQPVGVHPSFKQEYMQTENVRYEVASETVRPVMQPNLMKANPQAMHRPAHVEMQMPARMISQPQQVQTKPIVQTPKPIVASSPSMDTKVVTNYCENILNKLDGIEKSLERQNDEHVVNLESMLKSKEYEITVLNQQVEDLQVLIKMLESKKP